MTFFFSYFLNQTFSFICKYGHYIDEKKYQSHFFFQRHCTSRTYFLELKKMQQSWLFTSFLHCVEIAHQCLSWSSAYWNFRCVASQTWIRSRGRIFASNSHNKPFSPTTQTAENVEFVITCVEYSKPRLLHTKNKIRKEDLKGVKQIMTKFTYMCGSFIALQQNTGNDRPTILVLTPCKR